MAYFFVPGVNGLMCSEVWGVAPMPSDVVPLTDEQYQQIVADKNSGKRLTTGPDGGPQLSDPPPLTDEQRIARYEALLDYHMDSVARANGFQNRATYSLRAGFSGPFQAEATAYAQWMDGCYMQARAIKADVLAGLAPIPSEADFIAGFPAFIKPA